MGVGYINLDRSNGDRETTAFEHSATDTINKMPVVGER